MKAIRVVVVDDDLAVLTEVSRLLHEIPGVSWVGSAVDGREALEVCREEIPDVVILDMKLPDMHGAAVAKELALLPHPPEVVVYSSYQDQRTFHAALTQGVTGYLTKGSSRQLLAHAIHNAYRSQATLSPELMTHVLDSYREDLTVSLPELTPREEALLQLIAQGLPNKAIAGELNLSEATIKTYASRLLPKFGCHSRAELVALIHRMRGVPG